LDNKYQKSITLFVILQLAKNLRTFTSHLSTVRTIHELPLFTLSKTGIKSLG
jgi:hypothetical protein